MDAILVITGENDDFEIELFDDLLFVLWSTSGTFQVFLWPCRP